MRRFFGIVAVCVFCAAACATVDVANFDVSVGQSFTISLDESSSDDCKWILKDFDKEKNVRLVFQEQTQTTSSALDGGHQRFFTFLAANPGNTVLHFVKVEKDIPDFVVDSRDVEVFIR